jgi:hypothetical protein
MLMSDFYQKFEIARTRGFRGPIMHFLDDPQEVRHHDCNNITSAWSFFLVHIANRHSIFHMGIVLGLLHTTQPGLQNRTSATATSSSRMGSLLLRMEKLSTAVLQALACPSSPQSPSWIAPDTCCSQGSSIRTFISLRST